MIKQNVNQNWKMRRTDETSWQQATVPGTVYTDLLRNGNMEDPYFKDNENKALELMEYDYEYETTIEAEEALFSCDKIVLHADGLDTIADIFLNGENIGHTFNMHREWEFDVTEFLKKGSNVLHILFHSPNKHVAEEFAKCRTMGSEDCLDGFVHMRKAHCMFGWDWGAHLPDAGIFRPIYLVGVNKARVDSVYISQTHKEDEVSLDFSVSYKELFCKPEEVEYCVSIISPKGEEQKAEHSPRTIVIKNPMLWWPNGFGEQNLYSIRVSVLVNGAEVDSWEKRIGLRTMTMKREKDEWGESFAHEVNGITIFAMGADYIPEDHLLGKTTPERTRQLLEDCKLANFNSIRVWGGGYYPEDWFFDSCDELGLIVWQDFMFACAVYELTKEFKANIRQEFIDNIKRIRHHASLGLWCGNNEMEQFVGANHHWVTKHSEVRDYIIMYEQLIPEVLEEYDPSTFYWPASPSSGGSFDEPNDPNRGDVHYWEVWHGNKPFSEYRKYFFRYASEFGFQSFPAMKTIEAISNDPKDQNVFSYIMEKHQRNYGANGKIMNYLQQTYLYPTDFKVFLYASQLLQAEAMRYGIEHFRRNRGRCMGAIYWQLNDCWPVISWASVDYFGRWKALHYYAKRFFAPLMISCQEEGMMSAEADMNRQHFEFEKSIHLNVTNETMMGQKAVVEYEVRNAKSDILRAEKKEMNIPALSSVWLEKEELPQVDIFNEYVSYRLLQDGEEISSGTVIFSYPKYFRYENPELEIRVENNEIIVSAKAYAKSVEILNEEEDLVLSDNYFDMNAGEKRVQILRGEAKGLRVRSVFDIR